MGGGAGSLESDAPTSATCLRSPCSYKWVQVIPAESPVDRKDEGDRHRGMRKRGTTLQRAGGSR